MFIHTRSPLSVIFSLSSLRGVVVGLQSIEGSQFFRDQFLQAAGCQSGGTFTQRCSQTHGCAHRITHTYIHTPSNKDGVAHSHFVSCFLSNSFVRFGVFASTLQRRSPVRPGLSLSLPPPPLFTHSLSHTPTLPHSHICTFSLPPSLQMKVKPDTSDRPIVPQYVLPWMPIIDGTFIIGCTSLSLSLPCLLSPVSLSHTRSLILLTSQLHLI